MPSAFPVAETAPAEFLKTSSNALLAQCLWNRGIRTPLEAESFLVPKYEELHDPFLFTDMAKAVQRLKQAVRQGEVVGVYADYDADAVTASVVVLKALQYVGGKVASFIPDRFSQGYGVHVEGLQKLKEANAKVVVTVDCGINAVEAGEFCARENMDFIITDHHQVTGELPQALARINPNIPTDPYPDKNLTGVGVAYKLVCGIFSDKEFLAEQSRKLGQELVPGWEKWLLDLVAIGTVADCQSLLGENRILVHFGLRVMQKSRHPGLRALLALLRADRNPTSQTIAFHLAPRINAAGRLEHADLAQELLLTDDPARAQVLAQGLEQINVQRKNLTDRIYHEAMEQWVGQQEQPVVVAASPNWHKGVVGIVASRLVEASHRPAIILAVGADGVATGSMRAPLGYNAVELLSSCRDVLRQFGGHPQAAGLSLLAEDLPELKKKLWSAKSDGEAKAQPALADALVSAADCTFELAEELSRLAPFGAGNPEPQLLLLSGKLIRSKFLGEQGSHMRFTLDFSGVTSSAVAFRAKEEWRSIPVGTAINLVARLEQNFWQGQGRAELVILDLEIVEQIYE